MSLLLEALKKAEKSKQANAARQDARGSPSGRAPEKVREPSPATEPQEAFDLNELTLAPPRESAPPGEESGATAFPEISLPEVEPAGAAAPLEIPALEIPAWEPPAPEAPTRTPDAEAASHPSEAPAIALSMELPESPAGKAEPFLALDFPQAEASPEQKPERKENLEAVPPPSLAPIEPVAPQPGEIQTDGEPHHIPVGGGLPPSFSVTETQGSGPRPFLQGGGADGTGAATPSQPLPPAPAAPTRPAAASAAASGAEAAKKILAASRGKPVSNPKLLGGILLVSILAGAAGYYYYQQTLAQPGIGFRLPPPVGQAPLAPPAETPVAPPAEPPAATPAEAPAAPEQPAHIAEKSAEKPAPPPEAPARVPKKAAEKNAAPPSADTLSGSVPAATPPSATPTTPARPMTATNGDVAGNGIRIRRDSGEARLDPLLAGAWQAYMAGDSARAENDYRRVLKQQPNSRDALLGLAAIASGRGQPNEAAALYQQVLQLDPRDAAAQAGLIGLRGYSDPNASESRLKILLGQSPDAGYLHFALGNLYAHQSRWPEAQEAYFNALHSDAGNADYAFNLAVSLDHLDQHRLALDYYRRALDLAAQGKAAAFDRARAKNRIQELLPPPQG